MLDFAYQIQSQIFVSGSASRFTIVWGSVCLVTKHCSKC